MRLYRRFDSPFWFVTIGSGPHRVKRSLKTTSRDEIRRWFRSRLCRRLVLPPAGGVAHQAAGPFLSIWARSRAALSASDKP